MSKLPLKLDYPVTYRMHSEQTKNFDIRLNILFMCGLKISTILVFASLNLYTYIIIDQFIRCSKERTSKTVLYLNDSTE